MCLWKANITSSHCRWHFFNFISHFVSLSLYIEVFCTRFSLSFLCLSSFASRQRRRCCRRWCLVFVAIVQLGHHKVKDQNNWMIFSVWWLLRFILQVFVYLLPAHIYPLPVLNFTLLYALTSNNFNEIDCSCRSVKECRLCAQKAKNHVLFTWIPYCTAPH